MTNEEAMLAEMRLLSVQTQKTLDQIMILSSRSMEAGINAITRVAQVEERVTALERRQNHVR